MTASVATSGGRLLVWLRDGGAMKLIKFGLGSVVAALCSALAFALCYGTGLLSTTPASAVAFVAGAIPNYYLNRRWAWQRQGRVDFWREIVLYAVISLVSFAASAAATGAASRAAQHLDSSVRTALVTGAYVATYGVLFFAKFICYEIVVFADRSAPRRAS